MRVHHRLLQVRGLGYGRGFPLNHRRQAHCNRWGWWRQQVHHRGRQELLFERLQHSRQLVVRFRATTPPRFPDVGFVLRTLMVHQMMSSAKSSAAPQALERLHPFVDEDVRLQLVAVREPRAAQVAGVGPLARVHPQVPAKIRNLHELPLAVGTMVGFLARVQTHVRLEVVVPSEALVALLALEGLLARMRPLVVLQDVLVAEAAVADVARELLVLLLAVVVVVAAFHRDPRLRGVDPEQGVSVADVIRAAVGLVAVEAEAEEGVGEGRAAQAVQCLVVEGRALVDHPGGSSVRDRGAVGVT